MNRHTLLYRTFSLALAVSITWIMTAQVGLAYARPQQASLSMIAPSPTLSTAPGMGDGQDVIDTNSEVWDTLWGQSFENDAPLPSILGTRISDIGFYEGLNHLGQTFQFDVVFTASVDLEEVEMSAAARAEFEANNVEVTSTLGWLSSDLGSLPVSALAISADSPSQGFQSAILPSAVLDDLSWELPLASSAGTPGSEISSQEADGIWPDLIDALCRAACEDQYNQALQDAQDTYATCMADAASVRDGAIATANEVYNAAVEDSTFWFVTNMTAAHVFMTGALAGCAVAGGILSIFTVGIAAAICIAAVMAAYALQVANLIKGRDNDLAAAAQTQDFAIQLADQQYEIDKDNCDDDLEDAEEEAEEQRDACLNGCDRLRAVLSSF